MKIGLGAERKRGILEGGKKTGTLDELEGVLVESIFDYVLKNPTINKTESRYIPEERKRVVKEQKGFQCQICGEVFDEKEMYVVHIFPHVYGGSNYQVNLMPLCKECNLDKGKRLDYYRSAEGKENIKSNISIQ